METQSRFTYRAGTLITDTGVAGLAEAGDISEVDIRDLDNVTLCVNCIHAGTGGVTIEGSYDGVNWLALHAEYDASGATFVAGEVGETLTLSDANGMPYRLMKARARMTTGAGAGLVLSFGAAGLQKLPYR